MNQPCPSEQALNGHMNHYPIVLRAAREAVEAYQKGDGPDEELRLKVLDTDCPGIMWVSSTFENIRKV